MKNKKLIYSLFIILLINAIFLNVNMVSAFMPPTHQYEFSEAMKIPIDSNEYKACVKYPDLCYSGNVLTDVSVLYYYTNFKRYTVTHSPSFCVDLIKQANTDEELACAVGACTHQSADWASHVNGVPYTIKHTFLTNSIIHTFEEQHVDNWVLSTNPKAKDLAIASLNSYKKCVPLMQKVMEGSKEYNGVDLSGLFEKFIQEIQGSKTGYDAAFTNLTAIPFLFLTTYILLLTLLLVVMLLLIFKRLIYRERRNWLNWTTFIFFAIIFTILMIFFVANLGGKAFSTFVWFIKPISNIVPILPADNQVNMAITGTTDFFKQGTQYLVNNYNQGLGASGQAALEAADAQVRIFQWSAFFIVLTLLIIIVYFNFRRSNKSYSNENNSGQIRL